MGVCGGCKKNKISRIKKRDTSEFLKGKKAVISGYSARAINSSAKFCGLKTLVIDCFADMDMRRVADKFIHVNLDLFKDPTGHLEKPSAHYLYEALSKINKEINNSDYLLIGSGFENYPEYLEKLEKFDNYWGSSAESISKVRTVDRFLPFLMQNHILFPKTISLSVDADFEGKISIFDPNSENVSYIEPDFQSGEELIKTKNNLKDIQDKQYYLDLKSSILKEIDYPIIIKSEKSGGGFGIYIARNSLEFNTAFENLINLGKKKIIFQEFVEGNNMSCSFLSNGTNAQPLFISEQIIGDKKFGSQSDFAYCGNIISKNLSDLTIEKNSAVKKELTQVINEIVKYSGLVGSNGIDFIQKINPISNKTEIYVIEINARFQGTIDLFEEATGYNIVDMHLKSISDKELPEPIKFPSDETFIKSIFYSPLDFHIMVDLNNLEFNDAPLIGNFIPKGSPLCSSVVTGVNIEDAYNHALDDRDLITRIMRLNSRLEKENSFFLRE